MVTEGDPSPFLGGEVDTAEHSRNSRAKKVVDGPLWVPKHATLEQTVSPLDLSGGSATLERNKAYRVIATVPFWMRQSNGTSAAVVGDIFVPANTPVVISTRYFNTVSVLAQAAAFGVCQAVEVQ